MAFIKVGFDSKTERHGCRMSRISPYNLGAISPELENFRDEITNAWNYGKYPVQIVTALPTWRAQPGEMVLFRPSSGGTTNYFYAGSAWISSWSVTS